MPTIHRVFGLGVRCHFPLPELPQHAGQIDIDIDVRMAPAEAVHDRFSGRNNPPQVREGSLGGHCHYRTERGVTSDYRIDFADRATFHLTRDARQLECAPSDTDDVSWRRFLLDTGLVTAALVHGFEAFHAAAFERFDTGIAVMGDQGTGKTTVLAESIRRGASLLCDDVLCVSRDPVSNLLVAHPGPPLMNLEPVLPGGTRAEELGTVLATVEGESWLAVDRASIASRSITVVVFLERGEHEGVTIERVAPTMAGLLRFSLASGREPARLRRRFALCADLASEVAFLRLRAGSDQPAADLVDALERALEPASAATNSPAG